MLLATLIFLLSIQLLVNGFFLRMNCNTIDSVIASHVKDWRVHIDENLNFEKQVADCAKKANGILASIKRTIKFVKRDTFKLLYKSLVHPILELTGSVWNPYTN